MATLEEHEAHDTEAEKQILSDVAEHGFHVALLNSDGYSPSFAYTIGLYKTYGYPELVCFGLHLDLLHSMLWEGKRLLDKQPELDLTAGYADFLEGFDVRFLRVNEDRYSDYLGYAKWFYDGGNFPVLQLVWPDKQAQYPWDDAFNPNWKFKQPLLDRNTDFKFREERNLGVFTTRQVLEGKPVLRVSHDVDGDWQFLCDTTSDVGDLKLVALEEIVQRDSTLNKLFELNYGWSAWRETPEHDWETWEKETDVAEETE
jgi:hypothetical protein